MMFGKQRKNILCKKKAGDKNTKSLSYKKQKYIIPRDNQTRKKASHHHTPRSPRKKRQETVSPSTIAEPLSSVSLVAVSPVAEPLSSVSLVAVSPIAEPLSSVSLVAQELMPRELRSTKDTNDVGNNGKMASDFMIRRLSGGPLQNPEGLKKM